MDPRLFRALADPTRLRLLANLVVAGRPCSVSVAACCCDVDLSVVSRHLAALEEAAALTSRREGRQVLYTARTAALAARLRAIAEALESAASSASAPADGHGAADLGVERLDSRPSQQNSTPPLQP